MAEGVLLGDKQEAVTKEPAPDDVGYNIPPPDGGHHVLCAFVVYITDDGQAIATTGDADPNTGITASAALTQFVEKLDLHRQAQAEDMLRACDEVARDVNRGLTAQLIVNAQLQIGQQMQQAAIQAQQEAQIRAQIAAADAQAAAARGGRRR